MNYQLLPYPSNQRYSMRELPMPRNNEVYGSSYVEHHLIQVNRRNIIRYSTEYYSI